MLEPEGAPSIAHADARDEARRAVQRLGLRGAVGGKLQAEHALGTEREAVAERVLWWWLRWGWRPTVQAACPRAASKSTDAADAAPRPVIASSSELTRGNQGSTGGALTVAANAPVNTSPQRCLLMQALHVITKVSSTETGFAKGVNVSAWSLPH